MSTPSDKTPDKLPGSGVEALIERVRQQGVDAGRQEAARLETEARQRAEAIERAAEQKARATVEAAIKRADALENAGREALRVAMRDTLLALRAKLMDLVSDNVRGLITTEMDKSDFLRQLIRDVALQAREQAGVDSGEPVRVLLPASVLDADSLRQEPLQLHSGGLTHFVLSVAGDVLQEGVSLGVSEQEGQRGIRLYLENQQVHIELTDKALAELLLAHLQPRFRAALEGMVQ